MANLPDAVVNVKVRGSAAVLDAAEEAAKVWGARNVGRLPSQGTGHVEELLRGPMLALAQAVDDYKDSLEDDDADEKPEHVVDEDILGDLEVWIGGKYKRIHDLIMTEDGLVQPTGYFSDDGGKTASYPKVGHRWYPGRPHVPLPQLLLGRLVKWQTSKWWVIDWDPLKGELKLQHDQLHEQTFTVSTATMALEGTWERMVDIGKAGTKTGDGRPVAWALPEGYGVGEVLMNGEPVDKHGFTQAGYFSGDNGKTARFPQKGDMFFAGRPEVDERQPADRLGDVVRYRDIEWLITEVDTNTRQFKLLRRFSRVEETCVIDEAILKSECTLVAAQLMQSLKVKRESIGPGTRVYYAGVYWSVIGAQTGEKLRYILKSEINGNEIYADREAFTVVTDQEKASSSSKTAGVPQVDASDAKSLEAFYEAFAGAKDRWHKCECEHCVGAAAVDKDPELVWQKQDLCPNYQVLQKFREVDKKLSKQMCDVAVAEPVEDAPTSADNRVVAERVVEHLHREYEAKLRAERDEALVRMKAAEHKLLDYEGKPMLFSQRTRLAELEEKVRKYEPGDPRANGVKGDGNIITHPSHYNHGKYEAVDVIEDWKLGFNLGNVMKYICRAEHKGTIIKDLEKARFYLSREIQQLQKLEAEGYEVNHDPNPSGEEPPIDCGTFKLGKDPKYGEVNLGKNPKYKTLTERIEEVLERVLDKRDRRLAGLPPDDSADAAPSIFIPKGAITEDVVERMERVRSGYQPTPIDNLTYYKHDDGTKAAVHDGTLKVKVDVLADDPSADTVDGMMKAFEARLEALMQRMLTEHFNKDKTAPTAADFQRQQSERARIAQFYIDRGQAQAAQSAETTGDSTAQRQVRLCGLTILDEWEPYSNPEAYGTRETEHTKFCSLDPATNKWEPLNKTGDVRVTRFCKLHPVINEWVPVDNAAAIDGHTLCRFDTATEKWEPIKAPPASDAATADYVRAQMAGQISSGSSS